MYTSTKVTVFNEQHDKLKNAIAHQKPISIKLNLNHGGGGVGGGEHTLLLTRGQSAKIERSKMIGKHQVTLHLSKRQAQANVQHQGMLARLAAKAFPSILGGLAAGLMSGAVKRAVGGDVLYLHKLGHCVKIDTVRGNGL